MADSPKTLSSAAAARSELLTPREVCARLKIAPSTLSGWERNGAIDAIRLPGGHRRYRAADIEAIERGEVSA